MSAVQPSSASRGRTAHVATGHGTSSGVADGHDVALGMLQPWRDVIKPGGTPEPEAAPAPLGSTAEEDDLARAHRLRTRFSTVGVAYHLGLGALFLWLGSPWMAAYSLAAAALFLGVTVRLSRERDTTLWLPAIEANVHLVIVTWVLGLESGYHLNAFPLALLALVLARSTEVGIRAFSLVLPVVGFLVVHAIPSPPGWRLVVDPAWMTAIYTANVAIALLTTVSGVLWFNQESALLEERLRLARQRTQELLARVLPEAIALRLLGGEGQIADHHAEVTVLFADLVGFTRLSERLPPAELVALLNDVFARFDAIAHQHGVEKIKTMGDGYMAAAGVPEPMADHAGAMAAVALGLRAAVQDVRRATGHDLQVRVGVHSGSVVAGVIGQRRFGYDLWGDTVNIASRMESHGVPGAVQVSDATRRRLEDRYRFTARGAIEIKGKDAMEVFLLEPLPEGGD